MADTKRILIKIDVSEKGAVKSIDTTKKSVDNLAKSTNNLAKATNQSKTNSGLNNAIIAESARLASDASYGFTAMANNLGQLVSLFAASKDAAGGFMGAIRALFTAQSLFLIGIQLLITFGDDLFKMFVRLIGKSNELREVFKDAGSTVQSTAGQFETYIRILQDTSQSQEQQRRAIDGLNKEYPDFVQNLKDAGYQTEDLKNKTNDIIRVTNEYREALYNLALARAAQNKIEELAGEAINAQIEATEELKEAGLTLDEARELSAQRDDIRFRASEKRGTAGRKLRQEQETQEMRIADNAIKQLDKENIRIQELINQLIKYTEIELDSSTKRIKKRKEEGEEKNKYDMLEIGNFDRKIQALKEMGRLRDYFFNRSMQMDVATEENSIIAIEREREQNLARIDALKSMGLLEEELAIAKYEVNSYYNKLLAEEQEQLDRRAYSMRLQMFGHYADALGSVSQLMEENSKAQKIFALAEIAANTAIGFAQGLTLAQQQAKEAAPVSAVAFPLFYASQIAAVLAAAARAKSILNGGSPSRGGIDRGTVNVEAPDFNVVGASPESQLAQSVAQQQQAPLRAFVVGKEITTQQEFDRNIVTNASL